MKMKQLTKYFLTLLLPLVFAAFSLPTVHAEAIPSNVPQETLKVHVIIDQPDLFWNYSFLTKDADLGKPETVKLVWGTGESHRQEKTEVIVSQGKKSGQLSITADRGALVNLQIVVCDAHNTKYGSMSFQVRNNGQTQDITVAPPDSSEPKIDLGSNVQ
jgi:hypothetical protein